jgi:hypothetical protein
VGAVLSAIWAYAGVAYRETEAQALSLQEAKRLRSLGFARAEILLVDGETLVNRASDEMDRAAASCLAAGIETTVWATPRPAHVPIEKTVELAVEAAHRYGSTSVVYQTEAEFEYSNGAGGGTPASRYSAMEALGAAHRRLFSGPTAIYVRGSLVLADAAWTTAWHYGMRPLLECYAVNESPTPAGFPPRPDWAAAVAKESMVPRLVGGWSYRVRLGTKPHVGRLSDDERFILVPGHEPYRVGSAAGPRHIANFGDPKWGAILGFFPGSWLKIAVSPYPHPLNGTPEDGQKPTGAELAAEIRAFQATVKKHGGGATKGYTVWAAAEMTDEHHAQLSPKTLTGAALLP